MRILVAAIVAVSLVVAGHGLASDDGLKKRTDEATPGYTLLAPLNSKFTSLIDLDGEVVHRWESAYAPGNAVYLLPDGDLLRTCRVEDTHGFHGGGIGGRLERYSWSGELLWEYSLADDEHCQHHDVEPLPNGNILVIAWERLSRDEALALGRDPESFGEQLWPDQVFELKPRGRDGAEIVWRWRARDHVVQHFDPERPNYGDPADHPRRIDINYTGGRRSVAPEELERLRGIGYVGGDEPEEPEEDEDRGRRRGGRGRGDGSDWLHTNAISWNAELDQIALSVHSFSEVWIIDHSTTTEQAATSRGGRGGHGGDLLYRWGNPAAYGAGSRRDQRLFAQHDVRWVAGASGGWELSVYNNGRGRGRTEYSSVERIALPLRGTAYELSDGVFGPSEATWQYAGTGDERFYSSHISGAQVLASGNVLVCVGESGRVFEVTPEGRIVWDYVNRHGGDIRPPRPPRPAGERAGPPGGRGRPGPGGPEGRGGPGRPGGPGGPGDEKSLFRVDRYGADHPAIKRFLSSKNGGSE